MSTFADAAQVVRRAYVGPDPTAIRVAFVASTSEALPANGRLVNMLLDRLRGLFVATGSDATGSPAIRVYFATPVTGNTSGPGRMPPSLDSLMRAVFTASDAAIADGAPALRVQFV